jgi:hypothetical protein
MLHTVNTRRLLTSTIFAGYLLPSPIFIFRLVPGPPFPPESIVAISPRYPIPYPPGVAPYGVAALAAGEGCIEV